MTSNAFPVSLVFDTETNGLPPKDPTETHRFAPYSQWKECRMQQLAWVIIRGLQDSRDSDNSIELHRANYYMSLPPDVKPSPESVAIHGITDEEIKSMPLTMHQSRMDVLTELFNAIERYGVQTLVAHNLEFDYHILINEIQRTFPKEDPRRKRFKDIWMGLKGFCTYRRGQACIREERRGGSRGMPYVSGKLLSFYNYFVGSCDSVSSSIQLHRADGDVELTRQLYQRLRGFAASSGV